MLTDHCVDLKPRRGGPFIATGFRKRLFLFVFRRRGLYKENCGEGSASNHTLRAEMIQTPRRRKTKRNDTIGVLIYKRATPTGFLSRHGRAGETIALVSRQLSPVTAHALSVRVRNFLILARL